MSLKAINTLTLSVLVLTLSGCITTRSQLKDNEMSKTVSNLQQEKADVSAKFSDMNSEFRRLNGRIEVLELNSARRMQEQKQAAGTQAAEAQRSAEKLRSMQEAIVKLEARIIQLEKRKVASAKNNRSTPKKGNYTQAEIDFKAKRWKKAIFGYQKYRDLNPKGRRYAEATYKIGVSFQELKLKSQAAPFYQEVISKFPKSSEAKRAKTRLKQVK